MNEKDLSNQEGVISPIHTACKDCVFMVKNGQTQTGCKLGRIDLYRKKKAEILSAYDEFNNEFFVINDRFCIYKRSKEWGEELPTYEWEETVRKQTKPRYQAIVFFRDEHKLEDLHKTMESLVEQYNSPIVVTIANSNKAMVPTAIINSLERGDFPGSHQDKPLYEKFEWRLQTFLREG